MLHVGSEGDSSPCGAAPLPPPRCAPVVEPAGRARGREGDGVFADLSEPRGSGFRGFRVVWLSCLVVRLAGAWLVRWPPLPLAPCVSSVQKSSLSARALSAPHPCPRGQRPSPGLASDVLFRIVFSKDTKARQDYGPGFPRAPSRGPGGAHPGRRAGEKGWDRAPQAARQGCPPLSGAPHSLSGQELAGAWGWVLPQWLLSPTEPADTRRAERETGRR